MARPRILLVVLDGAADRPEPALSGKTPLELAQTPNLDCLIGSGLGALVEVLPGQAVPQTHSGMLSLLGYPEIALKVRRGSLEAAVIFGDTNSNSLFARGNLSSIVDEKIPSRRVNRDVTQAEADELCAYLSNELTRKFGIGCKFKSYSTYRLAVALSFAGVPSDQISNTDPGYAVNSDYAVPNANVSFPMTWSKPLVDDPRALSTATAINEMTLAAHKLLDVHPINDTRRTLGQLPINHILLRDFGTSLPPIQTFSDRWKLKSKYFHDLPVELGVAKYLGMDHEEAGCKDASVGSYARAATSVVRALAHYDLVVFHIKGPDEPGHDGNWENKTRAIEKIDTGFFAGIAIEIDQQDFTLCVTSDHATCWSIGTHTADKVALALAFNPTTLRVSRLRLTEADCSENTLGISGAWELMPLLTKAR